MINRVLVVCGAGASSTFLVHAMRREIQRRGSSFTVDATTLDGLSRAAHGAALVLVARHLEAVTPALRSSLPATVRLELLPALSPTGLGPALAVDIAERALSVDPVTVPFSVPQGGTHA